MYATEKSCVRVENNIAQCEPGILELIRMAEKRAYDLRERITLIGDSLVGAVPQVPHDNCPKTLPPGITLGGIAGVIAALNAALGDAQAAVVRCERSIGPATN